MRSLRVPRLTSELAVGGGVWRLAWHPVAADTLLVAAMQAGFAVLRGCAVASRHGESAKEDEHGSLAYGVGWCELLGGKYAAISTNFYDRSVHVWKADD